MVVRVGGPGPELVESLMLHRFPGIVLKERHGGLLQFQLPSRAGSLASVFSVLAAHRGPCHIEDYSVSQTTLDQVTGDVGRKGTGDRVPPVLPLTLPPPRRSSCTLPGSRLTRTLGGLRPQGRMRPPALGRGLRHF